MLLREICSSWGLNLSLAWSHIYPYLQTRGPHFYTWEQFFEFLLLTKHYKQTNRITYYSVIPLTESVISEIFVGSFCLIIFQYQVLISVVPIRIHQDELSYFFPPFSLNWTSAHSENTPPICVDTNGACFLIYGYYRSSKVNRFSQCYKNCNLAAQISAGRELMARAFAKPVLPLPTSEWTVLIPNTELSFTTPLSLTRGHNKVTGLYKENCNVSCTANWKLRINNTSKLRYKRAFVRPEHSVNGNCPCENITSDFTLMIWPQAFPFRARWIDIVASSGSLHSFDFRLTDSSRLRLNRVKSVSAN